MTKLALELPKPVRFMEVCGTHTTALFETGLRQALPPNIEMISGPGCPVCVTPDGYIDAAIDLAEKENVLLATFGDMLRVPGKKGSLAELKGRGGSVEVVYSPLAARDLARNNKDCQVVFLAVGFETTAPAVARALALAAAEKLTNFTVLTAHKTIPTALGALLSDTTEIDGLMCPGHVSVIIGSNAYQDIAAEYNLPCVVSGFSASFMIDALIMLVRQAIHGDGRVENAYPQAVKPNGNPNARELINTVFQTEDAEWRGTGEYPPKRARPKQRL